MIWSFLYWLWLGFNTAWFIWFFVDEDVAYYVRNKEPVNKFDKKKYLKRVFWPITNFIVAYNIVCIISFVLKWWVF